MAKKSPGLDEARVTAIADRIAATFGAVLSAKDDADTARQAAQDAAQGNVGTREGVLEALAQEAVQGAWSEAEIRVASKLSVSRRNDQSTAKTLGTFVSEARRVMQPSVAPHMSEFIRLRDAVWDFEEQLPKDQRSVRGTYARKYHALLSGLVGAHEAGTWITTVDGFVAHAVANHPSKSASKVAARIESIRDELAAIAAGFPSPDLEAAITHLACVTEAVLVASSTGSGNGSGNERPETPVVATRESPVPSTTVPEILSYNHQEPQVPEIAQFVPEMDGWDEVLSSLAVAA